MPFPATVGPRLEESVKSVARNWKTWAVVGVFFAAFAAASNALVVSFFPPRFWEITLAHPVSRQEELMAKISGTTAMPGVSAAEAAELRGIFEGLDLPRFLAGVFLMVLAAVLWKHLSYVASVRAAARLRAGEKDTAGGFFAQGLKIAIATIPLFLRAAWYMCWPLLAAGALSSLAAGASVASGKAIPGFVPVVVAAVSFLVALPVLVARSVRSFAVYVLPVARGSVRPGEFASCLALTPGKGWRIFGNVALAGFIASSATGALSGLSSAVFPADLGVAATYLDGALGAFLSAFPFAFSSTFSFLLAGRLEEESGAVPSPETVPAPAPAGL